MTQLERLQTLTEIVREFKTAILNNTQPEKIGSQVVEIIEQYNNDTILQDQVLNAYLKRADRESAVRHLDEATKHLHTKIDELLSSFH